MTLPKILAFLGLLVHLPLVRGIGEGPNGIYAVDGETALVADTDFNSVVLVNVRTGGVVEELSMDGYFEEELQLEFDWETKTGKTPHFVGITSCETCEFILATYFSMEYANGTKVGNFDQTVIRLDLKKPLSSWRDHEIGLENATAVRWTAPDQNFEFRMITMNEDGTQAYIADLLGHIWILDPLSIGTETDPMLTELAKFDEVKGVMLSDRPDELIATGESGVAFVNTTTGEKTCTVEHEEWPLSRRDAVMDPTQPDTLILFAGGGLREVIGVRKHCSDGTPLTLGPMKKYNGQRAWLDGDSQKKKPRFARPHTFRIMPSFSGGSPTEIILTDMDNGVLRLVQLGSKRWQTSTIIYKYDNDRMNGHNSNRSLVGSGTQPTLKQCPNDSWVPSVGDDGDGFCWKSIGKAKKFNDAEKKCAKAATGGRLCTAFEASRSQGEIGTANFFEDASWTSFACESCWHGFPGYCTPKKGDKEIDTWSEGHLTTQVLMSSGKRIVESKCTRDKKKRSIVCCVDAL